MPLTRYGFESGVNGDSATTPNSGSTTQVNTGGTNTISTTWAKSGTRSLKSIATSTSGGSYLTYAITSSTAMYTEIYAYLTGTPSAEVSIFFYATGTTTRCISLGLTTSRTLLVRDGGGSGGAVQFTSSAIPLNTPVKIAFFATQNATTGTFRLAWGVSPYTSWSSDSTLLTGKNTGAGAYDAARIGSKTSTGTQTLDAFYFDDWGWQAGGTNFPVNPPTITGPSSQSPYSFLDLSGTTFDVGPIAYTATPSTGVVGTPTGIFLPAPTDGSITTYTVTATDTGNGATDTTSVDVAATGGGVETVVWSGTQWT